MKSYRLRLKLISHVTVDLRKNVIRSWIDPKSVASLGLITTADPASLILEMDTHVATKCYITMTKDNEPLPHEIELYKSIDNTF
jgi:hypothetical protein